MDIIDWEGFRSNLEDILGSVPRDDSKSGRIPFDPLLMFNILMLQKFDGHSDASVEEPIMNRFSFIHFLGPRRGDAIPDANTL